jgi:hypothetical protein
MTLRIILPAIIGIAAFSSCATAYRTGQTPDDVYYSPARQGAAYATMDQQRDGRGSYQQGNNRSDYYSYDDRWLRMRVMNRNRWSAFDDYDWNDWRYNSWSYNSYSPYGWNNYWNSYYRWNSWYNPYCGGIIVVNPKTNPNVYTKVRNFSLNSYTNTNYNTANNSPTRGKGIRLGSGSGYNNSNSNSGLGSSIRKVFGGSGSSRDSYYSPGSSGDRPSRTYTPSSSSSSPSSRSSGSSSSGSSGSSGGGGGVSRPSRGGN